MLWEPTYVKPDRKCGCAGFWVTLPTKDAKVLGERGGGQYSNCEFKTFGFLYIFKGYTPLKPKNTLNVFLIIFA